MPWKISSASKHTKKADTPAKSHQWSTVANKILDESGDDAKAIRIANASVKKTPSTKSKPNKKPIPLKRK